MTDGERKQLAERIIELERENEMLRKQIDAIMHDLTQQVIPCPAQELFPPVYPDYTNN